MLYNIPLWIDDIDTVSTVLPELDELAGKSILITGASGLICSAVVDVLFRYNDTHNQKIHILGAGRSEERMRKRFGNMIDRNDFTFVFFDAINLKNRIDIHADYIIHGAGNAYPALISKEPVETMLSNFMGTKYLLDYARQHQSIRYLYISSSEVYGKKNDNEPFKEDEYGYIDLLNSRNSYSVGKRAAETLCVSYADEYGVDSVIVRPGHIYGPTASQNDNRVSSAWAYLAASGKDIVMKSNGSQIRSYCYCLDSAAAIISALFYGDKSCAYNISNPVSIVSIKELGMIMARNGNCKLIIEVPSENEKKGFNPMYNSSLDGSVLLSKGCWKPCFDIETGISHTVQIIRSFFA